MRWLALEAGDAATWGSTVVTFGMACYAIAQGIGQKRDLRRQNELQSEASQLQRRQVDTAERRTLVMEQLLAQLTAAAQSPPAQPAPPQPVPPQPRPVPSPPQGQPSPPPPPSPPPFTWPAEPAPEDQEPAYSEPDWLLEPPYGVQPTADSDSTAVPGPAQRPGAFPPPAFAGTYAPRTDVSEAPHAYGQPRSPWQLERSGQHSYALRNTGSSTLTGVRVSRANLPTSARGVPENAVVRAGETAEFLMAGTRGDPLPAQVLVSWQGHFGEVAVPVPER
ncbi:MAG TPA: hypothetical protein VNS49_12640 [Streptomyces sp.]|nr:hypothetical protein [Streptomyces sp.]